MYIVHDDQGKILHSISGPDASYGDTLTVDGQLWIFLKGEFEFNPIEQYVDVKKKKLATKKKIPLVFTSTFKADGKDQAKIYGIPKGSNVKISSSDVLHHNEIVDDGVIELTSSTKMTMQITVIPATIEHQTTTIEVTAK